MLLMSYFFLESSSRAPWQITRYRDFIFALNYSKLPFDSSANWLNCLHNVRVYLWPLWSLIQLASSLILSSMAFLFWSLRECSLLLICFYLSCRSSRVVSNIFGMELIQKYTVSQPYCDCNNNLRVPTILYQGRDLILTMRIQLLCMIILQFHTSTVMATGLPPAKHIGLFVFLIACLALNLVKAEQIECLLQDQITDECLGSMDVEKIVKTKPELAGYICTIMTMKMQQKALNEGALPDYANKASKICQAVSPLYIANGYNTFEIYLLQGQLSKAFQTQYELFFLAPFNHEAQMAKILPKYKQILESQRKTILSSQENSERFTSELISLIYLDKADEAYKLLNAKPEFPITSFLRVRLLEKSGQFMSALQFINEELKDKEQPHWYHFHLQGNFLMHHIQFRQALRSFEKSLEANTKSKGFVFTYYNMGLCYQKLNEFEQSLVFLKKALLADPKSAEVVNALGFSYYELMNKATELEESNKYEKLATRYFKEAITLNEAYSVPYYNYGMLLYERGHFKSSADMFKKAIEHKLDFQSASYAMFKALYMIDKKKAFKYMDDHLATGKEVAKDLAVILYQVGEYLKAYEFIKDAVDMKRQLDQVYEWKGVIQFHLDQFKAAEESFFLSLNYGNNKSTVYFNLGYLYRIKKDYSQSLKFFQKSLEAADSSEVRQQIKEVKNLMETAKSEGKGGEEL